MKSHFETEQMDATVNYTPHAKKNFIEQLKNTNKLISVFIVILLLLLKFKLIVNTIQLSLNILFIPISCRKSI